MSNRQKLILCGVLFTALAVYWFPWGILSRPEVSSTVFDSAWQQPETRVASNGVEYQVYPGGGIVFHGDKRPAGLDPPDVTLTAEQYVELSNLSPIERLKFMEQIVQPDMGDPGNRGPVLDYDPGSRGPQLGYDPGSRGPVID